MLLSGGYKAVVPQVIACCEFLSVRARLTLGINFEDSESLIELPLRGAPPLWREAILDPAQRDGHPLDGWAFTAMN